MRKSLTIALVAVAAATLVVFARPLQSSLGGGAPNRKDDHFGDNGRYLRPDEKHEALLSRIQDKVLLSQALVRGELNLTQAAERFRELSGDQPDLLLIKTRYPQASEEELWQRQVINYVHGHVRFEPERIQKLVTALEAEVARRFQGSDPRLVATPVAPANR